MQFFKSHGKTCLDMRGDLLLHKDRKPITCVSKSALPHSITSGSSARVAKGGAHSCNNHSAELHMEQINQLIKEIEESNFKKCDATRIEANELSQKLGGQTIPRNADPAIATAYVALLLVRKTAERVT